MPWSWNSPQLLPRSDDWHFIFRRRPYTWEENQLASLRVKLNNFPLNPSGEDCPCWKWSSSASYSVESAYSTWEKQTFQVNNCLNTLWKNLGPARIGAFVWQAVQEKIATRSILVRRNIIPPNDGFCPICALSPETPLHLFLQCSCARSTWSTILSRWLVSWIWPSTLPELVNFWFSNSFHNLEETCWITTLYAVLWSIWKARNDLVFNDKQPLLGEIVDLIKAEDGSLGKRKMQSGLLNG